MAVTGHAGSQAPQSMHSSGWIKSIVAVSNSGSSFFGWIQSTGHASTHAVSFVPMHGSQIMYSIRIPLLFMQRDSIDTFAAPIYPFFPLKIVPRHLMVGTRKMKYRPRVACVSHIHQANWSIVWL